MQLLEENTNQPTISRLRSRDLLACPFCGSAKIMCEGTAKRMAMVCQKCLSHGPEVSVESGRAAVIREWNSRA